MNIIAQAPVSNNLGLDEGDFEEEQLKGEKRGLERATWVHFKDSRQRQEPRLSCTQSGVGY